MMIMMMVMIMMMMIIIIIIIAEYPGISVPLKTNLLFPANLIHLSSSLTPLNYNTANTNTNNNNNNNNNNNTHYLMQTKKFSKAQTHFVFSS
jgi:hypothetical protein